jgi:RNA polymerase sigma-70 factor (ECF subfamily)
MKPNEITPEQFLGIYDEMADLLFRFALVRVGNREDAVDIVQTTFTRAWGHIRQGKEVPNYKAFLYKVARNLIIDVYRKTKNVSLDALAESEGFDPVDEKGSKETLAFAEWRIVEDALNKMSPTDKDVIIMRFIEGRMPQEIAEITGLSENVISVRINRAVERLKRMVNEGT